MLVAHRKLVQQLAGRFRPGIAIRELEDNAILVGVPLLPASIFRTLSEEAQIYNDFGRPISSPEIGLQEAKSPSHLFQLTRTLFNRVGVMPLLDFRHSIEGF